MATGRMENSDDDNIENNLAHQHSPCEDAHTQSYSINNDDAAAATPS